MTQSFVAVGSNVHPEVHIPSGLRRLERIAPITGRSPIVRTPALGPDGRIRIGDPDFRNGAVRIEWGGSALDLRTELRRIEEQEERIRTDDPFAPRTLDLDILLFGNRPLRADGLVLPAPELATRPFLRDAVLAIDPQVELPPLAGASL